MSIWPKSFFDPASDRWRRKVESDVDAAGSAASRAISNAAGISAAITGLRELVAKLASRDQFGSVSVTGNSTAQIIAHVDFSPAYNVAPIVTATCAGFSPVSTEGALSGTDTTGGGDWAHVLVYNVTATGFDVTMMRPTGTYSSSNNYYFTWRSSAVS